MSFLSVLKTIGKDIGIGVQAVTSAAPVVVPVLSAINPAAGAIFLTAMQAIASAEALIPVSKSGTAKKAVAATIITANHPNIDPSQASALIDTIVGALNTLQKLMETIPTTAGQKPQASN